MQDDKIIKVAHITLSMATGGIEKLILNLCQRTNYKEFSPAVVCLDYGGELVASLHHNNIPCFIFKRRAGFDWRLILCLVRLFRDEQFDIIHSHNQASLFYAGIAAKIARCPVLLVTEHSRHHIDLKFFRRVEKRVLSLFTNKWVTVNDELAHLSKKREGIASNKIKVVPNGIDIVQFKGGAESRRDELRSAYGIMPSEKVLIMVARLNYIKNHSMLIDSLKFLERSHGSLKVLLVGDGECREEISQKICNNGLEHNVLLLGTQDNIPEILSISDVFVLCSLSEGLPLSLLEASAAGVPIVIADTANRAGFISHKKNGIIVENTPEDLANGIRYCLDNESDVNRMASVAREQVVHDFSLRSTIACYEDIYQELLD